MVLERLFVYFCLQDMLDVVFGFLVGCGFETFLLFYKIISFAVIE